MAAFREHNSGNNNNNNNSDRSSYTPPDLQFHPDFTLKVGQVLLGRLLNPARTSMAHASPTDGSVILATAVGKAPLDADGNTTGPVPQKNRTLLTANPRKMSKVRALQSENIAARLEKKRAACEGRTLQKGKVATLVGFMPLREAWLPPEKGEGARGGAHGRGDALHHQEGRPAREVSVDGIIVLQKSGPSSFGFRRTDRSYELRATEEGVVLSRRGMNDWGIKAQDSYTERRPPHHRTQPRFSSHPERIVTFVLYPLEVQLLLTLCMPLEVSRTILFGGRSVDQRGSRLLSSCPCKATCI
ncbi:unnamed protein product [Ectocarpus sp. 4 AP-2014]